ncbi:short chain dehydrogenase-like protein [Angomonas deanei]|uniref:KR domain/short chain dehydrogenase/Enoyl-(Acyl carrier protein) reductase, putative n=1 Tax=Angomonas deanei TaxID=59799 RepID=S9WXJ5_9TRYP|nr:short chain dehydrogenase-like protein [Angomonas deanei]EPY43008.1 short chain dehydrogenase-like protein [Angomonas deanei]CAD2212864.1 KR domain/short chain dehydrogenase/Enoyl-(Acyl carrier protein) reductase, putative [Angomonas deanei]|eukprot:EPY40775.1 short chain dehydrogenase-like protein [Angomonas deanei]
MSLTSLALVIASLVLTKLVLRRLRYKPLKKGAVAVITGGGSGVGLALAERFARSGCKVVLIGRNQDALKKAVEHCKQCGAPHADFIVADLSKPDSAAAIQRSVCQMHEEGSVKYLVLNAGAGAIAPFTSEERFHTICEDMMNINYLANVRLLQKFLPVLTRSHAKASPSRIIVISSLAGVLPSILRSAYTASKHAIQGFMNALRGETDIPITLCCPGYVDTDFHGRVMTNDGKPLGGHQRRGVSPEVCAKECLEGALHGDAEVIMTLAGKLGYTLRPWLTGIVDFMAKRKSLNSLKNK